MSVLIKICKSTRCLDDEVISFSPPSPPTQPMQYKLISKLARLLGIHTATRPDIINSVWQYIKVDIGCSYSLTTSNL